MQAIQQSFCRDAKPGPTKVKLVALPWQPIRTEKNEKSIFATSQPLTADIKSQLLKHF
jgi:hypothetical protein